MDSILLNIDGTIDKIPSGGSGRAAVLSSPTGRNWRRGTPCAVFSRMLEIHGTLLHLNAFFPDLIDQFHRAADDGCRVDGIDGLVLEKTVEMIGFPGEPRLEIYRSVTGKGAGKSVRIRDFQLDMLLDTQLLLGKLKHVIFGDHVDVFEFDTVFTLFELVEGIGWEFGFHGTPRQCQMVSIRK